MKDLKKIAASVRKDILTMSYSAQSAHVGGALSCVETLVSLYFKVMTVFPDDPYNDKRDRLFFSKAHDAKALYSVLCRRGFFSEKLLAGYEKNDGLLPGHSTRHCVPGVEISAGGLGHGLSMAVGSAYSGKLDKKSHRIYCILSDGECNEGSTWEAILFAGHHRLRNLMVVVDYNKLQGFGYTKDVLDLEPITSKWESFGWKVITVDGHSFGELEKALSFTASENDQPIVVIAHTIKGLGGVKKHINNVSSQYKPPTKEEYEDLMREYQTEK
jgi:transketolase